MIKINNPCQIYLFHAIQFSAFGVVVLFRPFLTRIVFMSINLKQFFVIFDQYVVNNKIKNYLTEVHLKFEASRSYLAVTIYFLRINIIYAFFFLFYGYHFLIIKIARLTTLCFKIYYHNS